MEMATSRQATSARITASGRAPPANCAPTMIEKATAAAGAIWVIDWNRTSLRPIASRARPVDGLVFAMTHLLVGRLPPPYRHRRNGGPRPTGNQDTSEVPDSVE